MPIQIVRNDITKMKCDAIVNAANSSLLGGGGVDGAIHRAAGRQLLEECAKLGGCKVGEAKATLAYNLPSKYVIHTVGPIWRGGTESEKELLESCYRESLKLASKMECETVAFPLISSGIYGYPKDKALEVAMDTIGEFLLEHDMLVYIVVFDKSSFKISEKLVTEIQEYIDDQYIEEHCDYFEEERRRRVLGQQESVALPTRSSFRKTAPAMQVNEAPMAYSSEPVNEPEEIKNSVHLFTSDTADLSNTIPLEVLVNQVDESFTEMLLRKIDEKGIKDSDCYKKANISRQLFSKIRKDMDYRPSKNTVIALAVALELDLNETKDMLLKAGFALSHSSKFDIIIEYFIKNRKYDVYEINQALFAFDQSLLGA